MTKDKWQQIELVVQSALQCPPASRAEWLDSHCGNDAEFRREVESLLAANSSAGNFLEAPALLLDRRAEESLDEQLPDQIGEYRVLRRLGTGGMGVVYLAQQANPERQIALKVMRSGTSNVHNRMRFAREAQVLGRLRHPGIAQIYEAGFDQRDGRKQSFIAMEYVEGTTLDKYLSEQRPRTGTRLRLFADICDAVQHAHQKGVIHRDLKPANIVIQSDRDDAADATPRAKILDFGIARITDDDSAAATLSAPQQMIGTLRYMSPEQVAGATAEIDTRTDVYALGVIGFEMLAGRLPYEVDGESAPELIRTIAEATPQKLGRIDPSCRGDVETIFAKALAKDAAQRYQSAAALAEDIRRYLKKQPITARPPSMRYQLQKFAQRERGVVIGASLAVCGLIVGLAFASWKAIEAAHERDRALAAEALADRRFVEANNERERAEIEAETASAVTLFLKDTLAAADPEGANPSAVTVRTALDRAAESIGDELADRPRIEAEIRHAIGETYRRLAVYDQARIHLEQSHELVVREYGEESLEVAAVLASIGAMQRELYELEDAVATFEDCLRIRKQHLEAPHADLADTITGLAATLVRLGDYDEAVELHQEALAARQDLFGAESLAVADSRAALAIAYRYLSQHETAEEHYLAALAIRRALLRSDHPHVGVTLHNYGRLLRDMGRFEACAAVTKEAIDIVESNYTGPHLQIALFRASYASALRRQGKIAEAKTEYEGALAMQRALFPDGHMTVANTLLGLGHVMKELDDLEMARSLMEEGRDMAARFGSFRDQWSMSQALVPLYCELKEFDRARAIVEDHLTDFHERFDEDNEEIAHAYMTLGEISYVQGEFAKAAEHVERSLAIRRRVLGDDHIYVVESVQNLGAVQRRAGNLERSHELWTESYARYQQKLGKENPRTIYNAYQLGWLLTDLKLDDLAVQLLQDCLDFYLTDENHTAGLRAAECAFHLQTIAARGGVKTQLEPRIDEALAHATRVLGDDHEYLRELGQKIAVLREKPAPAGD